MAAVWYYKLMGETHGPFTANQLRDKAVAGEITHDACVRKGHDGKWITADRVSGLFTQQPSPSSSARTTKPVDVQTPPPPNVVSSAINAPVGNTIACDNRNTKACPFCAEPIALAARKCKHCGEFLDGTAASSVSKSRTLTTSGPERTIWEGHPSALSYLAYWVLGVLLLPAFGVGLIVLIYAILDQKTKVFTHTSKRVISKSGIISRTIHEVTLTDIRSIYMRQNLEERLFGLGTVEIGSAGTAGIEVKFSGIANPAEVRDQIRQSKDQLS